MRCLFWRSEPKAVTYTMPTCLINSFFGVKRVSLIHHEKKQAGVCVHVSYVTSRCSQMWNTIWYYSNDTQCGICSKRNYKLQDTCGLLRLCLICEIWPATMVGVPLLLPVSNFVLFFVGVFVSLPMLWFVRLTGGRFPSWARRAMSCVVIPSILSSGWSFKRKHSSVLRTIL